MRFASLLVLTSALAGCAPTADRRGDDLPVTRAVLYQNGIGYFERRGKLDGDVLHMRVRPDQIRDILKSLTVVDLGDGRAVSIALPIEKARAKQLSELPDQVRTEGGLMAIARAFRGARCRIAADHDASGRLLGVENLGTDKEGVADWRISVLTDGGAVKQMKLARVTSLEILDGSLEIGLRKALDVALDAGAWKPVDLAIRLAGRSTHDLVASYVVEMPTWKPAYRVVTSGKESALLQGWAVVDNVSGEDWKGVRLSLTAGTPLAFTYDLYTPRYPQRPDLKPIDQSAQIPLDAFNAQSGIAVGDAPAPPPSVMESEAMGGAMPMPAAAPSYRGAAQKSARKSLESANAWSPPPPPPPPHVTTEMLERSNQSRAAGTSVSSLFRYDIEEPVTIDERQSALVNIVNARIPGEEALLFRVGADGVHPYRVVRFKNDTGFVLEAGPMAIYRMGDAVGGTFLGEALAGRIEKAATTFVPFAQDGRVRLTLAEEVVEQGTTLIRAVRGVFTCETKRITRYSYDVDNGSGEEVTLYVRRERRPGWTLVNQPKAIEEGGAYYLPIALAKAGRTKVTVEEESPVRRDVDIWNDFARQVIGLYIANAGADPAIAAQLKDVLALRDQVGQIDAQSQAAEEQRGALSQRQGEVRGNLQVLGKASKNDDLKSQLEKTLAELDGQLNELTRKLVKLSMDKAAANDRLAVLIRNIKFDSGK